MSPIPHDISPELVLVDPELAALARKQLPDPGWLGRRHLVAEDVDAAAPPGAERERATTGSRSPRGRASSLLLALGALSLALNGFWLAQALGGGTTASARADAGPTLQTAAEVPASAVTAAAPPSRLPDALAVSTPGTAGGTSSAGAEHASSARRAHARAQLRNATKTRVAGPTVQGLQWKPVARARYYDVVLWRDGKRVADLWPTAPRVVLPVTPLDHESTSTRLSPGRYLWFVYPGFGAKPAQQYGALAQSGVLVVQPEGGNERQARHSSVGGRDLRGVRRSSDQRKRTWNQ